MSKGITPADIEYEFDRENAAEQYRRDVKALGGVEAWGRYRVALREAFERWKRMGGDAAA